MTKTLLSKLTAIALLTALFLIYACADQELNSSSQESLSLSDPSSVDISQIVDPRSIFVKTVGGPIAGKIGREWIENYNRSEKCNTVSYLIATANLKAILAQEGCMGISFYYALDEADSLHILPIGITSEGEKIVTETVCTSAGHVSWAVAMSWIKRYPDEIKAHYFGANILSRTNYAVTKTTLALNHLGKRQLLLHDASIAEPGEYNDQSFTCPPACPIL